MTRQQQALDYFIRMGWTPEQAAGIVANLQAESGLNPAAVGDGGQAYGIAQWHPDRQAGFAALIGRPIHGSSLEDQLAWVHAELNGAEKAAGDALRACTSAAAAGACVSKLYERPADRDGEAARRAERAQAIYSEVGGIPGAAAPEIAPQVAPAPLPEKSMPILALLPIIAQLLPGLISAFGKNSDRAMQNAASAQAIADAVVKVVPGATGPGDVIDKLAAATKEEKAQITAAVLADPVVATLVEVGGGPAAARVANTQLVAAADKWWKIVLNPVLLVTALLIPLVYYIAYKLGPVIPSVSPDVIAQTIGTIIGMVLGSVTGFWMGMTYQQAGNNRRQTDVQPGNSA